MAVSLKDISERVHINTCSISQVLNNHPRAKTLRPETREKILAAARELGYFKNELAASVARKNSNVLVFVTADMGSIEYTGRIQNGVLDAAGSCNYMVILQRLNRNSNADTIRKILGWRAAGVIFHVADLACIAEITAVLDEQHIPWGTVNLSNPGGIGTTSDDFSGVRDAVRMLRELEHRKIAFFTVGAAREEFQINREEGYLAGIRESGDPQETHVFRANDPAGVDDTFFYRMLQQISDKKIDAVICTSDHLALALAHAAAANHLQIPQAFSIVGFGNSVIAENAFPPLSTIAQDFEEMGAQTVQNLVDVIEKRKDKSNCSKLLPTQVIQRFSVKQSI